MFLCDTGAAADAAASLLARLLWDVGPIPILLSRLLPSACTPLLGPTPVPMPLSRMLSGVVSSPCTPLLAIVLMPMLLSRILSGTISSPCDPLLGSVLITMLLSRILSGTVSSSCGPASTSWRLLDTLPCVLWLVPNSMCLLLLELAEASCLPAPYTCNSYMSVMQLKQHSHFNQVEGL